MTLLQNLDTFLSTIVREESEVVAPMRSCKKVSLKGILPVKY